MGFWRKILGKDGPDEVTKTAAIPAHKSSLPLVLPTPLPPKTDLSLPPEFDGKGSYADMFRTLPQERARAVCRALPIEQLDLNRPGRPPTAREMGRAITQVFGIATYMAATKEIPSEFGDLVFPRLVEKIEKYDGPDLHLELCDLVRDFGINLAAGERYQEALRVFRVLKGSLFWRTFSQGDLAVFIALQNIAIKTNTRQNYLVAIAAGEKLPVSQAQVAHEAVENLKQKMQAL